MGNKTKAVRPVNGQMSEQLQAAIGSPVLPPPVVGKSDIELELERLRAENAALKVKSKNGGGLSLRRSEKGAVSVYGLGRFPVTLYLEQWEKLLAFAGSVTDFINENRDTLKVKGE